MIVAELFACWEIAHAFCRLLVLYKNKYSKTERFRNAIELLNCFIQIRSDPFSRAWSCSKLFAKIISSKTVARR